MPAVKKNTSNIPELPGLTFLPVSWQRFIARGLTNIFAIIIGATALFLWLSLLSYNTGDASLNTAYSGDNFNWMGTPGAYIADIFMQSFGLASLLLAFITTCWAVYLYKRTTFNRIFWRVCAAFIAVIALATLCARFQGDVAPLEIQTGGVLGMLSINMFSRLFLPITGTFTANSVAFLSLIICVISTHWATRLPFTFWWNVSRKIISTTWQITKYIGAWCIYLVAWLKYHNQPEKIIEKPALETSVTAEQVKPAPAPPSLPPSKPKIAQPTLNAPKSVQKSQKMQGSLNLGDNLNWELPPLDLMQEPPQNILNMKMDENALQHNADLLRSVLADFNVQGEITAINPGPVVTLYELEPSPGTKTARVIGLADDIARSMSAVSVRAAVVPGQNVIGIELPNTERQTVYMREILESDEYTKTKAKLPLILGKEIGGQPIIADLARMPHLLVAGTTGSGKSVSVNTMILSLVYLLPPEKCRLIMIDPKMLELSVYDDIPHLLSPVVTEASKAVVALKWAVLEMEDRYRAMSKLGVRNIEGYNARLKEARDKGEVLTRKVQTGFEPDNGKPIFEDQPLDLTELPYIVVIVDEFADLMLVAGKDVEGAIQRLAQMARAAGIHLIMATQRPSVDVITGTIKANFPTRISFQVTSKIDSRTILGEGGAEQLLGMGDMLYMAAGGRITRVHGPFVDDSEVEKVVAHLKSQGEPEYLDEVTEGSDAFNDSEVMNAMFGDGDGNGNDSVDELYDKAVALVASEQKASTSFVQRHLQIGYNRAARIIEEMEKQGVIGKANHVGKREVLVGER